MPELVAEQVLHETLRFRAAVPELLKQHAGEWVVFREGKPHSFHQERGGSVPRGSFKAAGSYLYLRAHLREGGEVRHSPPEPFHQRAGDVGTSFKVAPYSYRAPKRLYLLISGAPRLRQRLRRVRHRPASQREGGRRRSPRGGLAPSRVTPRRSSSRRASSRFRHSRVKRMVAASREGARRCCESRGLGCKEPSAKHESLNREALRQHSARAFGFNGSPGDSRPPR